MKNRRIRWTRWLIWLLLLATGPGRAETLAIDVLHTFCDQIVNCADGAFPGGGLIQLADGNFYGATAYGGDIGNNVLGYGGAGTIYKITPVGVLTTLYTFCTTAPCIDGIAPSGMLTLGNDGFLYGTTNEGGLNGAGSIFKVSVSGQLTTLYSFCSEGGDLCTDGAAPRAGLIQGADGNFYGTTLEKGGNRNGGTIFKLTPAGERTTLYSFCATTSEASLCLDGAGPLGLLQGQDGNLYGTTEGGGAMSTGIVFKLDMSGQLTVLHNFCAQSDCADGRDPRASLIQDTQGNLYGTASAGGSLAGPGGIFGNGTIFKIGSDGVFTTLYMFCAGGGTCPDGAAPTQLMFGPDGSFYGLTGVNGLYTGGTVFELSASNVLTTLTSFCETSETDCPTGSFPLGFIRATDGTFYGTTADGGSGSSGIVFHLIPDEIFTGGFESDSSTSVRSNR